MAQKKTETRLRKMNATQINLSKQRPGFEFEGKYVGLTTRPFTDKKTGEEKTLHSIIVEDADGNRIKALADAGLRTAMEDAMLTAGTWFKAVKCEKTELSGGRTMNQWDIFQNVD